jgi:hypothetical protein
MTVTPNKPQMYGPSRAGQARGECSIHAPAAWQGPESLLTRVGSVRKRFSLALTLPRSTCRGLRGSGPFPIFGSQPRRQAIADLPEPIHSKISVPFAHEHEAKGVGSDQEAIGVYQNVDC